APQLALPILEDLADETQDFVGDESGSDPKTEVAYMRFSAWQILYMWRQGLPFGPGQVRSSKESGQHRSFVAKRG
ncbi:MAG: hypothetical protein ACT4P2_09445, partial [Pseudomonadota bacterium]